MHVPIQPCMGEESWGHRHVVLAWTNFRRLDEERPSSSFQYSLLVRSIKGALWKEQDRECLEMGLCLSLEQYTLHYMGNLAPLRGG